MTAGSDRCRGTKSGLRLCADGGCSPKRSLALNSILSACRSAHTQHDEESVTAWLIVLGLPQPCCTRVRATAGYESYVGTGTETKPPQRLGSGTPDYF